MKANQVPGHFDFMIEKVFIKTECEGGAHWDLTTRAVWDMS